MSDSPCLLNCVGSHLVMWPKLIISSLGIFTSSFPLQPREGYSRGCLPGQNLQLSVDVFQLHVFAQKIIYNVPN